MSQLEKMSTVFTFALVDVVSEDLKMSRGRARKAILRGQIWVDGVIVRDPETRVHGKNKVMYKP
jgi:predicted rRNA methylase YqxC with S4 and FtsJ domains